MYKRTSLVFLRHSQRADSADSVQLKVLSLRKLGMMV